MKLDKIAGKANQNLYRHPVTGVIYLWIAKKGKGRIQRSTGTDNLTEARRVADEMKYDFLGTRNPKHGRKLNRELLPEYLETKRVNRASTFDRYERSMLHLMPYLEDLAPDDLDETWWTVQYIPNKRLQPIDESDLSKGTLSAHRFFNDRKFLIGYLRSCMDHGLITRVPKLVNVDPESTVGKVYTDSEVKRLYQAAESDLKLQLLMAVEMTMRRGEINLLALDRIDPRQRFINLKAEDTKTGSKTKKGRSVPITDRVWEMIKPRLKHESGYLFPSRTGEARSIGKGGNQTAWETCKERTGIKGRFHDLRHTSLTKSLTQPGANVALICRYAGITLEEAESTYLHTPPEKLRLVATYNAKLWEDL